MVTDAEGNEFALKTVVPQTDPKRQVELEQALRDEADILKAIDTANNPVFAKFIAAETTGQPKLLMEYIPGESLLERAELKPLNEEQLRQLIASLGSAAAVLHGPHKDVWVALSDLPRLHGWGNVLVLRDIKPANVIVTDNPGRPYVVIDPATTKGYHLRRHIPEASADHEPEPIGTPPYDDPLYTTEREFRLSSDVYSIAVTCLEAGLPGGIPQEVIDEVEDLIRKALRSGKPIDRSKPWPLQELARKLPVRHELWQILYHCLSLNPNERPADARKLIELLGPRVETDVFRVDADGEVHLKEEFLHGLTERQQDVCERLVEACQFNGIDYWASHMKLQDLLKEFIAATKQPNGKIAKPFARLIGGLLQSVDLSIENDEMKQNKLAHPFIDAVVFQSEIIIDTESLIDAIARHKNPRLLIQVLGADPHFLRREAYSDTFRQALVDAFDVNPNSPVMRSLLPVEPPKDPNRYTPAQRAALLSLFQYLPSDVLPIACAAFEGDTHRDFARREDALAWLGDQSMSRQLEQTERSSGGYALRMLVDGALGALDAWLSTDSAYPGPVSEQELTVGVRNRLKQLVIEGARVDFHYGNEQEKLEEDLADFLLKRIYAINTKLDFHFSHELESMLADRGLAERPQVALIVLEGIAESDELSKIPNLAEPFIRNRLAWYFTQMKDWKPIDADKFAAELELYGRLKLTQNAKQQLIRTHEAMFQSRVVSFAERSLPPGAFHKKQIIAWKKFCRQSK